MYPICLKHNANTMYDWFTSQPERFVVAVYIERLLDKSNLLYSGIRIECFFSMHWCTADFIQGLHMIDY